MSFVLNRLVWGIGLGDIRDTQAGLKGISTNMMPLIERGMINGFPFDIELFAIATANNLSIEAVPVEYYIEDAPSTVMPIPVALDFIKCIGVIRRNFKRGRYHAAPLRPKILAFIVALSLSPATLSNAAPLTEKRQGEAAVRTGQGQFSPAHIPNSVGSRPKLWWWCELCLSPQQSWKRSASRAGL